MLSRALSLATVLVIGCFAAEVARAQNLEAGKTAAQIFSGSCTACHKAPRGLLRTVAPGSLSGFLRQHYTTSPDMAKMLSAYLLSNGAADTRYRADTPRRQPGDLKPASEPEQSERQGRKPSQEAAQPDADATQEEPHGRKGRHGKRLARPGSENPEAVKPAAAEPPPKEAVGEHDGRKPKQKLTKHGKHGRDELPKADAAKQESPKEEAKPETAKGEPGAETGKGETAKGETAKGVTVKDETPKAEVPNVETPKEQAAKTDAVKPDAPKPDSAKSESGKTEAGKAETGKSETGKSETDKSEAGKSESDKPESSKSGSGPTQAANPSEPKAVPLRADPVPAVTPVPKASEGDAKPSQAASPAPTPAPSGPTAAPSQATSSAEPAKPAAPPARPDSPPPSVASSTPPPAPAGPPVPPISQ